MTTLPQTTAIRLPRPAASTQLAPVSNGVPMMVGAGAAGGAAAMSGADMWRVIRSHLWLIISILILSIGGGIGANYLLGKYYARYTAVGYIQVQPTVSKSVITN